MSETTTDVAVPARPGSGPPPGARVLGSFGSAIREATAAPDEAIVFEFPTGTGHWFAVATSASAAPWMQFAAALGESDDVFSLVMLSAMDGLLRDLLVNDAEYRRFMRTATRYKVDGKGIFEVCQQVWQALADFPTQPPAASADGRPATGPSSSTTSSAPVPPRSGSSRPRRRKPRRPAGTG